MSKWPKQIPELTETQKRTRDEWMKYWHEGLPRKFGIVERFNHGYPVRFIPREGEADSPLFTLEIGAGLGEHINHEDLSFQKYYTLELRENMAETIRERFPNVECIVGDIQQKIDFTDRYFDRVIAIHVLEHLPNLPAAIHEIKRVLKDDGVFQVVIPCEGGLAYAFSRQISSVRMFNKKFGDRGMSYIWMMKKTEHVNTAYEILEELRKEFVVEDLQYFPLRIPIVTCNIIIGLNLKKK